MEYKFNFIINSVHSSGSSKDFVDELSEKLSHNLINRIENELSFRCKVSKVAGFEDVENDEDFQKRFLNDSEYGIVIASTSSREYLQTFSKALLKSRCVRLLVLLLGDFKISVEMTMFPHMHFSSVDNNDNWMTLSNLLKGPRNTRAYEISKYIGTVNQGVNIKPEPELEEVIDRSTGFSYDLQHRRSDNIFGELFWNTECTICKSKNDDDYVRKSKKVVSEKANDNVKEDTGVLRESENADDDVKEEKNVLSGSEKANDNVIEDTDVLSESENDIIDVIETNERSYTVITRRKKLILLIKDQCYGKATSLLKSLNLNERLVYIMAIIFLFIYIILSICHCFISNFVKFFRNIMSSEKRGKNCICVIDKNSAIIINITYLSALSNNYISAHIKDILIANDSTTYSLSRLKYQTIKFNINEETH